MKLEIDLKNVDNEAVIQYEKIIKENKSLSVIRIVYLLWLIFGFIVLFLIIKFIGIDVFVFIFLLLIFIGISYFIKGIYIRKYKKQIIEKVLNDTASNITYYANGGLSRDDYMFANFEKFGKYKTSDLIKGHIEHIQYELSSVTTYQDMGYADNMYYITPKIFEGVVVKLNLNYNFDYFVYVVSNKKRYDNNYLVLTDNDDFNKKYHIFSSNKEIVNKIFNEEIVSYILNLEKSTGIYFELKLSNDILYFRFFVGKLFIPNILSLKKEALSIIKYKLILNYIETTMGCFIKSLYSNR